MSRPYTAIFSFKGKIDIDTSAFSIQMIPKFIYVLHESFSGAFDTSDYVVTHNRKVSLWHIQSNVERKHLYEFELLFSTFPRGTEEKHKN